MGTVTEAFTTIHNYVKWLRDKSIRLDSDALMDQVKVVLGQAHAAAGLTQKQENIDKYARALRSLLSCEILPNTFSVTNGVSVPCYSFGDCVDGVFTLSGQRIWFHGVVVDVRGSTSKLPYDVFWVGQPPATKGLKRNPQPMSVHSLRSHIAGSDMGPDGDWIDIDKIRARYHPDARGQDVAFGAGIPSPTSIVSSRSETAHPNPTPVPPSANRPIRIGAGTRISPLHSEQEQVTSGYGRGSNKKRERSPSTSATPGRGQDHTPTPAVQASVPFSVHRKTFEIGDSVSFAISCLESFDQDDSEHPNIFAQLKVQLTDMAHTLAAMYHNSNYTKMVSDTLKELEQYAGPERPCVPHSKAFLLYLEKYGFCVTPRMFSKSEILCIAIAMLDTRHHFVKIEQKTGKENGFRGMAFLDPRVQRVMIKRLQRYGFANSRFHPEYLQTFSSVVINGGGSWLQCSDWEFNLQSRFVMDCSVTPFAIALSDSPGVLEANGLYVATKTKRNGKAVYVQVSLIEFEGVAVTDKNFTAFKTCVLGTAMKLLRSFVLDNQGLRREPCSPRVLWCTGGESWGVQLLPGFDTEMFVVMFEWTQTQQAASATCFKRTLFAGSSNSSMKSIMQQCNISMTIVAGAASEVIDATRLDSGQSLHYFSFGTKKYSKRTAHEDCMEVPPAMGPQAWHGDGPQCYDAAVYTDCGDLKLDAPSSVKRKQLFNAAGAVQDKRLQGSQPIVSEAHHVSANSFCPLLPGLLKTFLPEQNDIFSESWSALGAVFSGTFIETVADQRRRDRNTSEYDALRVPIPLGCMAPFTFYWKHRGKGDEVPGKTARQDVKVPVHARPHDYVYCSDPRKLPTYDTEATLEFTSTCSNSAACRDPGSQLQVMECLQTFTPFSPGHEETLRLPVYHQYFATQADLDAYVQSARELQCQSREQQNIASVDVKDWKIVLCCTYNGTKSVRVQGYKDDGNKGNNKIDVIVNAADFECLTPSFFGCNATNARSSMKYTLIGHGVAMLNGGSKLFTDSLLESLLKTATDNLSKNWCSATLHHLLCLLDTRFLPAATLSINERNVLVATSSTECHDLLPFYTTVGKLGTNRLMRLYTSRGVGTRIIVPDPFPVLTEWSFEALDPACTSKKLGFRVKGLLTYHPSKESTDPPTEWYTAEVAGIDSEGVVTILKDTPYRLAGASAIEKYDDSTIRDAMKSFPGEGMWFRHESIHGLMQHISTYFKSAQLSIDAVSSSDNAEGSSEEESPSGTADVSAQLFFLLVFFMHARLFGARNTACFL
jgi:hypothetical protein